jgi:hypothetical protein
MINVVTVHWKEAKWIDPQLSYLERNIDQPFRVYTALHGIDRSEWKKFHYAVDIAGSHPEKLNALAEVVIERSDPDDILLFIDGDAFPVRPIGEWMRHTLEEYPLAAVRRDENNGDIEPHPCFSFTTCGFWKEIDGDWREGGTWTNSLGRTTTCPGGNLLYILAERDIEWLPLLRTNTDNPHPLWYAVYGHHAYHHGAGFRPRYSRMDLHTSEVGGPKTTGASLEGLMMRAVRDPSLLTQVRPRHLGAIPRAAKMSVVKQKRLREMKRWEEQYDQADPFEQSIFDQLVKDPDFYLQFESDPGGPA